MTDRSPLGIYLEWLGSLAGADAQRKSYAQLMQILGTKEFIWLVPNDDNRLADGLDVRREFCDQTGIGFDELGPCSVLEVLVGLSRRLSFTAGGEERGWAWQLIVNLELDKMTDPISPRKAAQADDTLEALIYRQYTPDGQGGFFPLSWPEDDQRKVELWYQMAYYVDEIHPEY